MKKEIAKIWVEALRSGKYKQGVGMLATKDNGYCCLGVLCELAEKEDIVHRIEDDDVDRTKDRWAFGSDAEDFNGLTLPQSVVTWAGMKTDVGMYARDVLTYSDLAQENDAGKTFAEIADIIEREVDNL